MSAQRRVAVFYSHGPHFQRALAYARERWAGAELVAVVPPTFPRGRIREGCDRIVTTERARYGTGDLGAVRRLARQLRAERPDVFITMFPSLRQRLLAWASGAPERWCVLANGEVTRLRVAPVQAVSAALLRRIRGELTYARIWLVVRLTRARPIPPRN